ncbi:hypothetical protein OE88DRAFT_1651062 [Heliocybe sulcata]|uniref:Uncharacterized protein n=1 Tax=Heliocybe sulcata TaxID=5364 RepID=A0A5C3NJ03_9AGAM|nr:hypothetical protein OE88DRAFT_1651062 [Heliocybe sulcata]
MAGLYSIWCRGLPLTVRGSSEPLSQKLFYRFTRICPPRFLHLLDLLFDLSYLALLANFVLDPPSRPIITYGPSPVGIRGIFLILYSACSLLRSWSLSAFPGVIVLLSFMTCLPAVPYPGDNAFDALLLALSLQILALHLPEGPSPALLFNPERTLPLSTLFRSAVHRVFYPALVFFLPTLLITLYLLSTSLSDTFLNLNTLLGLPAPMETRLAFMTLGIILLLLFISFVILLTLLFPFLTSTSTSPSPESSKWDRYTEAVGLNARRLFVRSVTTYSTPYFFPPLLNFVPFVLVTVPRVFLYVVGRGKGRVAVLERVEEGAWWALVAPLGLLVASLRAWGLGR